MLAVTARHDDSGIALHMCISHHSAEELDITRTHSGMTQVRPAFVQKVAVTAGPAGISRNSNFEVLTKVLSAGLEPS